MSYKLLCHMFLLSGPLLGPMGLLDFESGCRIWRIRFFSLGMLNVKISSSPLHPWTPLLLIGIVRFDLVWKKNVQMFPRSSVRAKMLAFLYKRDHANDCLMDQRKAPLCCCLYWKIAGRDAQ